MSKEIKITPGIIDFSDEFQREIEAIESESDDEFLSEKRVEPEFWDASNEAILNYS